MDQLVVYLEKHLRWEVLDLVVRSEIRDGMTVIAVLHAERLCGEGFLDM